MVIIKIVMFWVGSYVVLWENTDVFEEHDASIFRVAPYKGYSSPISSNWLGPGSKERG